MTFKDDEPCAVCTFPFEEHQAGFNHHCPVLGGWALNTFTPIPIGSAEPEVDMVKQAVGGEIDWVSHPPHYTSHPDGYEALDVLRKGEYYNLTTAMKYLWRINFGSKTNPVEDAKKAIFYIQDWIDHQGKELG